MITKINLSDYLENKVLKLNGNDTLLFTLKNKVTFNSYEYIKRIKEMFS